MDCDLIEHLGYGPDDLRKSLYRHLRYSLGKEYHKKTSRDMYLALTLALRDRLMEKRLETEARYQKWIPSGCIIYRWNF